MHGKVNFCSQCDREPARPLSTDDINRLPPGTKVWLHRGGEVLPATFMFPYWRLAEGEARVAYLDLGGVGTSALPGELSRADQISHRESST
jgi:hypothetical protein